METQAMTIEEFIEARLAEDERIAKDTSGTATEREWVYAEGRISDTGEYGGLHAETHSPRDGVHIARHDPARVLRPTGLGDMSEPYRYDGQFPQPGDRVGWIGADGELRIDLMPETNSPRVEQLQRRAARLEALTKAIREIGF